MLTYYQLLEIEDTATSLEIKKAYRRLAKKFHPDLNEEDTTEQFIAIEEAYSCLSNKDARKAYDRLLLLRDHPHLLHSYMGRKFAQDVNKNRSKYYGVNSNHAQMNYKQFRRDDLLRSSFTAVIIQAVFLIILGGVLLYVLYKISEKYYRPFEDDWFSDYGIPLLCIVFPLVLIGLSYVYEPLIRYLLIGKPKSMKK